MQMQRNRNTTQIAMQCTGMGVALRYAGGRRTVLCVVVLYIGLVRAWYMGPKALGQAVLRRGGP